jgi:hypothetical protein
MSAVEVENSVYALGGDNDEGALDIVQKLSLDSLTWELMQLKLPEAASWFPCFKSDIFKYFVGCGLCGHCRAFLPYVQRD